MTPVFLLLVLKPASKQPEKLGDHSQKASSSLAHVPSSAAAPDTLWTPYLDQRFLLCPSVGNFLFFKPRSFQNFQPKEKKKQCLISLRRIDSKLQAVSSKDLQAPCVKAGASIHPVGYRQIQYRKTLQQVRDDAKIRTQPRQFPAAHALTLHSGLQMLQSCPWNKCGTSKSGPAFHTPARNIGSYLYNPLKHMSQGEVGYSHILRIGLKNILEIRKWKGDNNGLMLISSSKEDLNTSFQDCCIQLCRCALCNSQGCSNCIECRDLQ